MAVCSYPLWFEEHPPTSVKTASAVPNLSKEALRAQTYIRSCLQGFSGSLPLSTMGEVQWEQDGVQGGHCPTHHPSPHSGQEQTVTEPWEAAPYLGL